MKRNKFYSLLIAAMTLSAAVTVRAQVAIDETNFPDANFRAVLASDYDTNEDGILDADELSIRNLVVIGEDIADLTGIEHFTALSQLACSSNKLTSLDVSKNPTLTDLQCSSNQLTSLDLSANTALTRLSCSDNQLTSLNITKCTELTFIHCGNNPLMSIDVSKNTALTSLSCVDIGLTSIDVSNNTALTFLACNCNDGRLGAMNFNKITSLDISKNTELQTLYCYGLGLTSLDVSKNTALTNLICYNNLLTSLDVSQNTALTGLSCQNNYMANEPIGIDKLTLYSYTFLPQNVSSAVNTVAATQVWSTGGALHIRTAAPANAQIYSIGGALVKTLTVAGEATVALPKGAYIVNVGGVSTVIVL